LRTKDEFKNFQYGKPFLVIFPQALIFWFFCIKAKEQKNYCHGRFRKWAEQSAARSNRGSAFI